MNKFDVQNHICNPHTQPGDSLPSLGLPCKGTGAEVYVCSVEIRDRPNPGELHRNAYFGFEGDGGLIRLIAHLISMA